MWSEGSALRSRGREVPVATGKSGVKRRTLSACLWVAYGLECSRGKISGNFSGKISRKISGKK